MNNFMVIRILDSQCIHLIIIVSGFMYTISILSTYIVRPSVDVGEMITPT